MYRILIVDDELDVLEYFGRVIKDHLSDKTELDIYAIDSAERALDYFVEYKIDLIISDINMPGMTGLDFYHEIRKKWSNIRFIFLSGIMDFDSVYATAQDSHTRYLTKLEPVEKITRVVWEVLMEIERSYQEKEILQRTQEEIKQVYPMLLNRALGQFIHHSAHMEQVEKDFKKLNIELRPNHEIILIGAILDQYNEETSLDTIEHMGFVLKSLMNTYFLEKYVIYHYFSEYFAMPYIWVVQKKSEQVVRTKELLELVQKSFSANVPYSVSFAYGSVNGDLGENKKMYQRIQSMLGYRDKEMTEGIIPCNIKSEKEEALTQNSSLRNCWEELENVTELEHYLEMGMEDKFYNLYKKMVEKVSTATSLNDTIAQEIYFRIAVLLLRYINKWQLSEKMAFENEMYKLMRFEMHDSWSDAIIYLEQCAKSIFELYFIDERDGITNYIIQVRSYIRDNLGNDLNLVVLAEAVHLNASYLSRLFKKETGEKLYDYILAKRMNLAKEYIITDSRRIHDIAKDVGYESVQSFHRAFKKFTGMSPMDYRNRKE